MVKPLANSLHSIFIADDYKTYSQDKIQHAPYKIKSNKFCRQNTKYYPALGDRKSIDTETTFCAVENEYNKKKKEGVKTKLCAVSCLSMIFIVVLLVCFIIIQWNLLCTCHYFTFMLMSIFRIISFLTLASLIL